MQQCLGMHATEGGAQFRITAASASRQARTGSVSTTSIMGHAGHEDACPLVPHVNMRLHIRIAANVEL